MAETSARFLSRKWLWAFAIVVFAVGLGAFLEYRGTWPRGEALGHALEPLLAPDAAEDQSLVARAIWENYRETRTNASRWSGVYWGFTFTAALFSALAALVLKFETFVVNEGAKKDIAALLSVAAALLITVSTSGDFQRKWQANRIAAAELERTGYEFLEHDGANARAYLDAIGQTLLRRNMAIVGSSREEQDSP
jgi:hypothetical protein